MVALQTEADTVLPRAAQGCGATVAIGASLLLRCCGMGPERAADAARTLLAEGATALLSYGTAGALAPELAPGTLLLPERIAYHGTVRAVDASWRQRIAARLSPAPVAGLLLTQSRPLVTVADKADAFRATGAAAVDMESGAVLEVADAAGVPGLVLRAVIDGAATALPRAAVAGWMPTAGRGSGPCWLPCWRGRASVWTVSAWGAICAGPARVLRGPGRN